MAGDNPITYPDILAWAQLTGCAPSPWEISVLRRLDAAAMGKPAARSSPTEPTRSVDATDGREVIGFLRGKGARKIGRQG